MYNKRVKIFVILSAALLLVCLLRLAQMQLLSNSFYRERIAELKLQKSRYRQLKTIRGRILDRKGKILALDEPHFQLHINYRISSFLDERVRRARLLKAAKQPDSTKALSNLQKELQEGREELQRVVEKCAQFEGLKPADIENRIKKINNKIWNLRTFLAWVRNGHNQNILEKYNHKINTIPLSEAIADFEKKFPDEDQRLLLTGKVDDIADIDKSWPLMELKTDDDIFAAQLEFLDTDGAQIFPKAQRSYPYGSVAAQTIGWVGPARNKKLFADDKLASYLQGELAGRRPGVEYLCEAVLRGRRGEVVYDIDRQLISRTETQFGKDMQLALDIKLQKKIENYLANYKHDPNCGPAMAAVVIDVATGDILALVSMPVFDLNLIRRNYAALARDPNEPLRNRAINKQYPPGSVVKPLILIAGLESGKITPDKIINCPARKAPRGWPSCWIYNKYGIGHDDRWQYEGGNKARNAIKGSCNIYFSRLADRIDPSVLQQWLSKFGYGHKIPLAPIAHSSNHNSQNLRQAPGIISSGNRQGTIAPQDRRFFGIGQGNLRATPLQVTNAMAAIARGGVYKPPRLFIDDINSSNFEIQNSKFEIPLNISPQTLDVIQDGMGAVVNEPGGTAYNEFAPALAGFTEQNVKVYGKTGSTEKPANAWFAGFAEDSTGRSIAITIVVEGGEHGSSDAAPLARDIIQFCIEERYVGQAPLTTE